MDSGETPQALEPVGPRFKFQVCHLGTMGKLLYLLISVSWEEPKHRGLHPQSSERQGGPGTGRPQESIRVLPGHWGHWGQRSLLLAFGLVVVTVLWALVLSILFSKGE